MAEGWTWATWLPIGISLLALAISAGAAWVAWKAPQAAARLAEDLRQAAARRDLKRWVFLTLMQQRAAPFTPEAVQAFNAIDVVFVDAPDVREKWELYLKSQDLRLKMSDDTKKQRLIDLLAAMATDIGLTDIKATDIERSYLPDYLRMSQTIQVEEAKRRFSQLAANTTPQASAKPKP